MPSKDIENQNQSLTVSPKDAPHGSMMTVGQMNLPSELVQAAKAGNAMLVTKNLPAALPHTVQRLIKWKFSKDFDKVGVELTTCQTPAPIEDLEKAYEIISFVCKPSDPKFIATQYGKADIACKSRAEGSEDIRLRSAIFVEQLMEFPNDIIADAFNTWIRCEVFSPTVAQIRDLCWKEFRARYGMKAIIKKMLDSRRDPKARASWMEDIMKNNVVS